MLLFVDIEEVVLVDGRCGPLAFQLEYHDSIVVASSEEVDFRMRCDCPEPVVLTLEGLDRGSAIEVPNTDGFRELLAIA